MFVANSLMSFILIGTVCCAGPDAGLGLQEFHHFLSSPSTVCLGRLHLPIWLPNLIKKCRSNLGWVTQWRLGQQMTTGGSMPMCQLLLNKCQQRAINLPQRCSHDWELGKTELSENELCMGMARECYHITLINTLRGSGNRHFETSDVFNRLRQ